VKPKNIDEGYVALIDALEANDTKIITWINNSTKSLFDSVVAGAFQITFRVKMHVNDVFSFFKKLFFTSAHQNDPKRTNHIKF
jgi:hypothetical protein